MQEIRSLLPDLKGNKEREHMVAMFNESDKSWWYIANAWELIMAEYTGGDLLLLNTVIGEAQEEILGAFVSAAMDLTEDPLDPWHYGSEVEHVAKILVPLVLQVFGRKRFERIIRVAKDEQWSTLREWADEATQIDWNKLDA